MIEGVPQEVIIVEGRSDTQRLIETFGPQIKTIETGGSALSRTVLERIRLAGQEYGIIIFTDPDYQGDRIRRLVTAQVPHARQAYLSVDQAQSDKAGRSLGVEHAAPEAIRQALAEVVTPVAINEVEWISVATLMDLHLVGHPTAKDRRDRVARHFNLGHVNGKQLQKRLALYAVTYHALKAFLEEM